MRLGALGLLMELSPPLARCSQTSTSLWASLVPGGGRTRRQKFSPYLSRLTVFILRPGKTSFSFFISLKKQDWLKYKVIDPGNPELLRVLPEALQDGQELGVCVVAVPCSIWVGASALAVKAAATPGREHQGSREAPCHRSKRDGGPFDS